MKAYNRPQIGAEKRIALKRDLRPYGCHNDGTDYRQCALDHDNCIGVDYCDAFEEA